MDGSAMLPEFDHEFAQTRIALERVPEDRFSWKPHEKSYSLQALAGHLAELPSWTGVTLDMDVFELDDSYQPFLPNTTAEALERFDAAVAEARAKIAAATPEKLAEIWAMKQGEETIFSMPKGPVLRSFIFNHNVHHRAQLGVYLRLLDMPVPGHYGPSADEQQ